ncbi:MAG: T9SS type A sorting domain-containing protein [Lentimicrobiaceae bacterium]|jgi:hypothetical protein|nr:T9SS type A sorting domain-containing protein [Lentimicrobiaceae bacterium]
MKTINKKMICVSLMLFLSIALKAQNFSATYDYDANGNRISVTVIYMGYEEKTVLADTSLLLPDTVLPGDGWNKKITETLDNFIVTIYPNPTQGKLCVEIGGASVEQLSAKGNAIKLWDMQSRLLKNISPLTQYNFIDLSGNVAGTYLLKIYAGGRSKEYKIVKN